MADGCYPQIAPSAEAGRDNSSVFFPAMCMSGKRMLAIVTRVPVPRLAAWPPTCHLFQWIGFR